jgi:hypothetical protein
MIFSYLRRTVTLSMPKTGNTRDELGIPYEGRILNGEKVLQLGDPRFPSRLDSRIERDPVLRFHMRK